MTCQRCSSERVLRVSAKADDLCHVVLDGKEHEGYMPHDAGIGGGDYVEFKLCLDCGQVQGAFPRPPMELEEPDDHDLDTPEVEEDEA